MMDHHYIILTKWEDLKMTNLECTAIREFRRFAVSHIYPDTIYIIMTEIKRLFNPDQIGFDKLPQPIIKFNYGLERDNNNSVYINNLHIALKQIFISYFNNPEIIKLFRNRIYNNINDDNTKDLLNLALSQVQSGNVQYVSLLFNITILGDNVYVYL